MATSVHKLHSRDYLRFNTIYNVDPLASIDFSLVSHYSSSYYVPFVLLTFFSLYSHDDRCAPIAIIIVIATDAKPPVEGQSYISARHDLQ